MKSSSPNSSGGNLISMNSFVQSTFRQFVSLIIIDLLFCCHSWQFYPSTTHIMYTYKLQWRHECSIVYTLYNFIFWLQTSSSEHFPCSSSNLQHDSEGQTRWVSRTCREGASENDFLIKYILLIITNGHRRWPYLMALKRWMHNKKLILSLREIIYIIRSIRSR